MYVAFEYLTLLALISIVGFILFSLSVAVLAAQEGAAWVRQSLPQKLRQLAPRTSINTSLNSMARCKTGPPIASNNQA